MTKSIVSITLWVLKEGTVMSKYKVTATKTTTGMQVSAGTRGFEITFDEPESTNTGMNPVEILLASFGACQAITAQALAKKRNFDLRAFWVTIEGDLGREDVADGKNVRKFTEDPLPTTPTQQRV